MLRGAVAFLLVSLPRLSEQRPLSVVVQSILVALGTEITCSMSLEGTAYNCDCYRIPSFNRIDIILTHFTYWAIGIMATYYSSVHFATYHRRQFYQLHLKAKELRDAQQEISHLEAANQEIREEVALSGLNEMQVQLVHENASDIERNVRPEFKLDWRGLKFQTLLGSGTFGDCYKGRLGDRDVAIKKMRAGLINKNGFVSFSKEVVTLSLLDHVNIVTFRGYVLEPALLIVMDFVNGGTLRAYIKSADENADP